MLADEKEIMLKSQRQLRFVQVTCILVVVACIVIVYIRIHDNAPSPTTLGFGQVIIILLALWSGVSGFMMQRRFQRATQLLKNRHPSPDGGQGTLCAFGAQPRSESGRLF